MPGIWTQIGSYLLSIPSGISEPESQRNNLECRVVWAMQGAEHTFGSEVIQSRER